MTFITPAISGRDRAVADPFFCGDLLSCPMIYGKVSDNIGGNVSVVAC